MIDEDIEPALDIIMNFDEDDHECAQGVFRNPGDSSLFTLATENKVIGVTGFIPADGTNNSYWLEWTYLAEEFRKQGLGRKMLEELFAILHEKECRKLFVSVSDYQDPEDGPIYEDALHLYKTMGFVEEQVLENFYEPGESRQTLSYSFKTTNPFGIVDEDNRPIDLNGISEINETDDIYVVDWDFSAGRRSAGKELEELIAEAKSLEARSLFITFPSNVPNTGDALEALGFTVCDRLSDYFAEAIHEYHYRYNF